MLLSLTVCGGRDNFSVLWCTAEPKCDALESALMLQEEEESSPCPGTDSIRQSSLAPVRVGCEEAVTRSSIGTGGNVSNHSVCRWPVLISFDKYLSYFKLHHKQDPGAFIFVTFKSSFKAFSLLLLQYFHVLSI